jgi:hypothetical protein
MAKSLSPLHFAFLYYCNQYPGRGACFASKKLVSIFFLLSRVVNNRAVTAWAAFQILFYLLPTNEAKNRTGIRIVNDNACRHHSKPTLSRESGDPERRGLCIEIRNGFACSIFAPNMKICGKLVISLAVGFNVYQSLKPLNPVADPREMKGNEV